MNESITRARHLLQRSGFAETPARIVTAADEAPAALLAARLAGGGPIAPSPPPDWVDGPILSLSSFRDLAIGPRRAAIREARRDQKRRLAELQGWWIESLIRTEDPLGARMTLFWQNHFTSEARKVRYPELVYRQHATLMAHATGRFDALLGAVLRDPAMLIYLDNHRSRRGRLNENLARELLELFTLGEGEYAEADIRELARALTGLGVGPDLAFAFREDRHDPGAKTLLGVDDVRGVDDVVAVLSAHPATARRVVAKLWRAFVSPEPDAGRVEALARRFRERGLDVRALLADLFTEPAFEDPGVRGTLVKSPLEFVVGTHRALGLEPADRTSLVRAVRSMQQRPYDPPNVRGWVGGEHWVNSATLLARRRFVNAMLRSDALDVAALERDLGTDTLAASLLALPPVDPPEGDAPDGGPAARGGRTSSPIARLLLDPVYHLC